MSVSCQCCVCSGTGLCDELITSPKESNRVLCVSKGDREATIMRWPWPAMGSGAIRVGGGGGGEGEYAYH